MNMPPNPRLAGRDVQKKLADDTAAWLRRNDPSLKWQKLKKKQADKRSRKQAADNPALVNKYRKAMRTR